MVIGLLWPVDIARGQMLIASSEILHAPTSAWTAWSLRWPGRGRRAVVDDRPVVDPGRGDGRGGAAAADGDHGMLFGAGQPQLAIGAGLLLAVNVVCVIVAARLVFMAKGHQAAHLVRAAQGTPVDADLRPDWLALLAVLLVIVYACHRVFRWICAIIQQTPLCHRCPDEDSGTVRPRRYPAQHAIRLSPTVRMRVYAGMPRYSLRVRNNDFPRREPAYRITEAHRQGGSSSSPPT